MPPVATSRRAILQEIAGRTARPSITPNGHGQMNGAHLPTSSYFGCNTFGARQMRDKLPGHVYQKLLASVRLG